MNDTFDRAMLLEQIKSSLEEALARADQLSEAHLAVSVATAIDILKGLSASI
ncbi:hypothetical protein [Sphingomonas sp. NBWT7]|uniref:hypothetical protein n=1 Tax=Sphingomonas sp. NBWT7 TaxID=2596913 RepID=UPI001CA4FE49|nr:hypothetical protein [Sphingomonas sp. NBWT7]